MSKFEFLLALSLIGGLATVVLAAVITVAFLLLR